MRKDRQKHMRQSDKVMHTEIQREYEESISLRKSLMSHQSHEDMTISLKMKVESYL